MQILADPKQVQDLAQTWKRAGKVAFVPTMGCLHQGHLSLVKQAQSLGKKTIVSIFVNPMQFGPKEDFEKYPRPFDSDVAKLRELNVDLLFAPTTAHFYPEGFDTKVVAGKLAESLCGRARPGHFNGVVTVCLKLFQATSPDFAIFGEKDFQQVRLIEQMVRDLNLDLEIVRHPTKREADGLAMSSRNRYLSSDERTWAAQIPKAMRVAMESVRSSHALSVGDVLKKAEAILKEAPLAIEYLEIASEKDLVPIGPFEPISTLTLPRLFLAVRCGATRLIDNRPLKETAT